MKNRGDEVRLQAPRFGPLHLLADLLYLTDVHRVVSERTIL